MKINAKIVSLTAAAIMAVSAVGVSAANIPVPQNNNDAFWLAENFYYDGLYYEAKAELAKVTNNNPGYDQAKADAWTAKIDSAISTMEKKALLAEVQSYNDQGLYYEAWAALEKLDARDDITLDDYYSIRWWEGVLVKKLAALGATDVTVVNSGQAAINRVKATGFDLSSDYEWFTTVKVDTGYHVYVQTQLPGGGSKDVAAFQVSVDGNVVRVF